MQGEKERKILRKCKNQSYGNQEPLRADTSGPLHLPVPDGGIRVLQHKTVDVCGDFLES